VEEAEGKKIAKSDRFDKELLSGCEAIKRPKAHNNWL